MAVGDYSTFSASTSSTYVSFVPTGSNQFLVLCIQGANVAECYTRNDSATANNLPNTSTPSQSDIFDSGNKQIISNTNYCTLYGDFSTLVQMVQIA